MLGKPITFINEKFVGIADHRIGGQELLQFMNGRVRHSVVYYSGRDYKTLSLVALAAALLTPSANF